MRSKAIIKAIEDTAKAKNISLEKARKEAHSIMDEIASDFSYSMIKRRATTELAMEPYLSRPQYQ